MHTMESERCAWRRGRDDERVMKTIGTYLSLSYPHAGTEYPQETNKALYLDTNMYILLAYHWDLEDFEHNKNAVRKEYSLSKQNTLYAKDAKAVSYGKMHRAVGRMAPCVSLWAKSTHKQNCDNNGEFYALRLA